MQTSGATLLAGNRCSLVRTWTLAQGSHSAHGLLYLTAVRTTLASKGTVKIMLTSSDLGSTRLSF